MTIKTKLLGLTALVVLSVSASVGAVPISGSSLQGVLDGLTAGGSSSVNVNDDQYQPDEIWSLTGTGASTSRLIIELAGYADSNKFGIYDKYDPSKKVQLFSGSESAGDAAALFNFGNLFTAITIDSLGVLVGSDSESFSSSLFGFYLDTPDSIWYSKQELNKDQLDHMVTFQGNDTDYVKLPGTGDFATWSDNEFIFGWEDLDNLGDKDYDDFIVMVESVIGVPEPSTLALIAITLLGMGFVSSRSNRQERG